MTHDPTNPFAPLDNPGWMETPMIDWYERRHDLRSDQVFKTNDGSLVKLDSRVPGDGTKWYVADWSYGSWGYYDSTIEPGDLVELVDDPEAPK